MKLIDFDPIFCHRLPSQLSDNCARVSMFVRSTCEQCWTPMPHHGPYRHVICGCYVSCLLLLSMTHVCLYTAIFSGMSPTTKMHAICRALTVLFVCGKFYRYDRENGFVLNKHAHWIAIRAIGGTYWDLNSMHEYPGGAFFLSQHE